MAAAAGERLHVEAADEEHLGQGDTHIIQLRKLLDEQIKVVAKGGDPLNTFRDPAANVCLEPPVKVRMPPKVASDGRPDLTNAARKYSPAYRAAYANRCGPEALTEPVH